MFSMTPKVGWTQKQASLPIICTKFLFISLPFYWTCNWVWGEAKESPLPPSAWLISALVVPGLILVTPPNNLAPFHQPAPTWELLPVLLPGFTIYLCTFCTGVEWTLTLLPAFPPQEEHEVGMGSWLLKEEVSFHWQQGMLLWCTEDSIS